jgi:hypothetical protein
VDKRRETPSADLLVAERVLLFCVASGTEWERAGVAGAKVAATIDLRQ